MVRLGSAVLVAFGVLAGCHAEKFVSPDEPDLYKVPYDFAPSLDLGDPVHVDLSAAVDLRMPHDLASRHDASEKD